jgi:hypothetical protein
MYPLKLRLETERLKNETDPQKFFDLATEINYTGMDVNFALARVFRLSEGEADEASALLQQSADALYGHKHIKGITTEQRFLILQYAINNICRSGDILLRRLRDELLKTAA